MSKVQHCGVLCPQNNTQLMVATSSKIAKLPLALTMIGAALYTCNSFADNDTTGNKKTFSNAIVVTAPSLASPITTSINLNETPALQSASDGASVLTQIPGFSAIGNGGTNGDPTFRGMFGSRLAILTDGAQMLGACPNRMDNPSSYINPAAYDEVSIIKGPETVLWGPGNSAATVLFDRKREDFSEKNSRFEASVMAGTYGRFDRRLEGAVGNEKGYVRLAANESEANDYKDGDSKSVASAWDKWNSSVAFGWTPDKDTWLELELGRGDGEAKYAGRGMDGTKFLHETAALRFEKKNMSEHWSKLEAQFNYAYADHVMDNYTLRPLYSKKAMRKELDRRTQSGRVASTWDWDTLSLITGIDAKQEVHRSGITANSAGNEDYSQQQSGIFSELTWFLDDSQRLVSGLRFDNYHATDESNTTATAGESRNKTLTSGFTRLERDLSHMPATVYIGLGHSERFPDYWEIKPTNSSLSGAANAFAGVQPEKTTQIDVGLNYKIKNLSWWVSAYTGIIKDYIIFDYSNSSITKVDKVGNVDAIIAGAEVGARYQLTPHWSTNASVAYAWGQDTDNNDPLPQIAPLESKLGLTYKRDQWTTNTILRLVAPQNRINEDRGNVVGYDFDQSTGFATLGFNAEYHANQYLTLATGIDNLTNTSYSEHLNKAGSAAFGYAGTEAYNQPGRMIWASLSVKF
ncbi:TonB-dependent copper receptor [Marinomonas flavescens]|uniref:TonB-dependent copper receptor n=1 Tax=Marinomonas flavescens TaxID=2529379 RepID=UPI001055B2A5|nr:TonB-dependent copper receptor [Marinomonas flavescens]